VKKFVRIFQKTEEYFLIVSLAVMGTVLAAQIVCRYVFNAPIAWAEELARYLQIWITFVGIGFGIRSGSHISLNLLRKRMPRFFGYLAGMIYNSLALGVCVLVLINAPEFLNQQDKLASTMNISLQLVYVAIPIGFSLGGIYLVAQMVGDTLRFKRGEELVC
jgi:TRAP-type C4-dicarboxylate transport system permease small subunit